MTTPPDLPMLPAALHAPLQAGRPLLWLNPGLGGALPARAPSAADVGDAARRLARSAGLLQALFPETCATSGIIDSPLLDVPALQAGLGLDRTQLGTLLLKADHLLPVAGSIKARGGFHEVLAHAEALAVEAGLMDHEGDLAALRAPAAHELFSQRTIAVGSTGNLGMSIGIMAAALGFSAVVHMSADAKPWKKDRLRERGVMVVEHAGDYAAAVAAGRAQCAVDPNGYFVDDENSLLLFLGYAAAARQLGDQLAQAGRTPSSDAPLFVYLPCGVGGAPGGIAYGLKQLFGAHVHCFFAEPTASPCMLVQLAAGVGRNVSVYDVGLDNRTDADGLAVPKASPLASSLMAPLLSGIHTVDDAQLYLDLYQAWRTQGLEIEPSAAAGFGGPRWLAQTPEGRGYLDLHGLVRSLARATHVVWSTGGGLLPEKEHLRFRATAESLAP
ncbi:MAG TPA: D-serine ammonia-lyase [Bordetella sp.]